MTRHAFPLAAALLFCPAALGVGAALAEEAAPGRYAMQRVEGGIARLDTQTGEVTLCQEAEGQMTCRMAADEKTAYDLELDLLTKRVEALEKAAEPTAERFSPRLPTQEEIDQTMGLMERMMRSFMGIVRDLDGGERSPAPEPGSQPQKT
ncbi:hypothetical protein [Rhizobium sp. CC-YZS058]|uniref:hypothetical protein n=1 Tax=Rhizobium sp. CC-YZS058 TaxID=3042153 RepID=UPI002B05F5EF|nr:hypothetical protein [Rhizobium sp. CC-YZS058]MEA3536231.1 hypothetical protein [Rhizobium sp. CC-YZS058]